MSKKNTTPEGTDKKKDTRKSASYIVKSKTGYQETFTNLDEAKKKYNDLRDSAEKRKQATSVKLYSRIDGENSEICGVDIKEDHFNS